jgi:hypothetical protein
MIPRMKRVLIGVAAGMGILVIGVWTLIHTIGDHDQLYAGKPIYYWQQQINNPVAAVSNETRVVVETQIIPQLTDVMFHDTQDSTLRVTLVEQLNNLPGVLIYYTPASGRRAQAVGVLGSLGDPAQKVIPDLIKAVNSKDEAVRVAAVSALGQIKAQPDTVIPFLISSLSDPQDGVPEAAVESLGNFGSLSRPAWPKLIPLLKMRDKDMQRALSIALKQIDPEEAAKVGVK